MLIGFFILFIAFEIGWYGWTALLARPESFGQLAWYQVMVGEPHRRVDDGRVHVPPPRDAAAPLHGIARRRRDGVSSYGLCTDA